MPFLPERGHIIWLVFDPQAGHELAGRRPALVLSPRSYNARVGLLMACPITGQVKGFPFEVVLPPGLSVSGVVLSDQIRSLDWRARKAALICRSPSVVLDETLGKAGTLLRVP